ncbi:unnamed protein product [Amoebophrya sp. A25]|nr:unnamed protein product [Amoebophrya sp. A25]|eukprot:GSA25T00014073001.1
MRRSQDEEATAGGDHSNAVASDEEEDSVASDEEEGSYVGAVASDEEEEEEGESKTIMSSPAEIQAGDQEIDDEISSDVSKCDLDALTLAIVRDGQLEASDSEPGSAFEEGFE